jgi:hypothetical protein
MSVEKCHAGVLCFFYLKKAGHLVKLWLVILNLFPYFYCSTVADHQASVILCGLISRKIFNEGNCVMKLFASSFSKDNFL